MRTWPPLILAAWMKSLHWGKYWVWSKHYKTFFLCRWWRGQIVQSACHWHVFSGLSDICGLCQSLARWSKFWVLSVTGLTYKEADTIRKYVKGVPLGQAVALPRNIRLTWKNMPRTNTLDCMFPLSATEKKCLLRLAPGLAWVSPQHRWWGISFPETERKTFLVQVLRTHLWMF